MKFSLTKQFKRIGGIFMRKNLTPISHRRMCLLDNELTKLTNRTERYKELKRLKAPQYILDKQLSLRRESYDLLKRFGMDEVDINDVITFDPLDILK